MSHTDNIFAAPKITMRIEVVRSNFKHFSSMGEESARAIVDVLHTQYTDVVLTNIDNTADLNALIARNPDLVFLGINYIHDSHDNAPVVWMSHALESNGIRHTGSSQHAHQLQTSKDLAKQRMKRHGVKTADFHIARRGDAMMNDIGDLTFPLFVKPSDKGGGQGIDEFSVVHTLSELQSKISSVHRVQVADALVETYLRGREFSIAVIRDAKTRQLTAMPIELVANEDSNGDRMLSNMVKHMDTETILGVTDPIEHLKLTTFAIEAFQALGARDYGRIDVRFNEDGVPHFLEANLIPSLINKFGSFPRAYALNLGRTHTAMILHIAYLGLTHDTKTLVTV